MVQVSHGGTNTAKCAITTAGHLERSAQSCTVTQTNTTGANNVLATEVLRQNVPVAFGEQHVTVTQRNGSGNNTTTIEQSLTQITDQTGSTIAQSQEAHQGVGVTQSTDTGANSSGVHQFLSLSAVARVSESVTQSQNTGDHGPNTLANIDQTSNTGTNTSSLSQSHRLEAQAPGANGPVDQSQGSMTGGLHGDVHQDSSGMSTSTSDQNEDQIAHATTLHGMLTQNQIGPIFCCGADSSIGNDTNSVSVNQKGHQESDGGSQTNIARATCRSSGTCGTQQQKDNNIDGLTIGDSCEGSVAFPCVVDRTVECTSEGCSTFSGGGGGSPASQVTKSVRNVSNEQSEYTTNTSAGFGDTIEYQIVYSNGGTAPATGVTITDVVPSTISFTSCTGGCVYDPDNRTITWVLGAVPPDNSRTVTFTGVYDESCSGASNTATADSVEEEPVTSNSSNVFVLC